MPQYVATIQYTDGVWRSVYEEADGRQYVVNADEERVHGVWYIPRPDAVVE